MCSIVHFSVAADPHGRYNFGEVLLDKLLSDLYVHVEPFSICLVSKGWRLWLPGPPSVMLHFVLQGEGGVRDPHGNLQPLAPGWLVVVPKGAKHALESTGKVRHEISSDAASKASPVPSHLVAGSSDPNLIIDCGLVSVLYGESLSLFDHLREVLAVDLSDSPEVRTAFQGIMAEQSQPRSGSEAMRAALMRQCLVYLFRRISSYSDCPLPWLTVVDNPRLGQVVDKILEEPGAHHTVDSLADLASMSRSAFAQRFVATFGLPPMRLVHHIRMQRAAHLLRQGGELSIDAVAERIGFSSRSHFSRAFKKHYGVSPPRAGRD